MIEYKNRLQLIKSEAFKNWPPRNRPSDEENWIENADHESGH